MKNTTLCKMALAACLVLTQNLAALAEDSDAVKKMALLLQGQCANKTNFEHTIVTSTKDRLVAVLPGAEYGACEDNRMKLSKGTLLVASAKPMVIDTGDAKVRIDSGATVVVRKTDRGVSVTNIQDFEKDCVGILIGNRSANLNIGNELVYTGSRPTVDDIFTWPGVERRHVKSKHIRDFGWLTVAQVNLPTLITHEPILASLLRKGTTKAERTLANKMTKTAVIMQMVLRDRTPFIKKPS